jgi:hypothetical protein
MPAHLETGNPANVPLYERHGFKSLAASRSDRRRSCFPCGRPLAEEIVELQQ